MADERKLRAYATIRRSKILAHAAETTLKKCMESIIKNLAEAHEGIEELLVARDLCKGMQAVVREMIDTLEDV